MSEDCHEIGSGYYCTCCGVRGESGVVGCSCADQKCPMCPRCILCCKTPALHKLGYQRMSPIKPPYVPEPIPTQYDREFLDLMLVAWEGDYRETRRAA